MDNSAEPLTTQRSRLLTILSNMETTTGQLGFTIPLQSLSSSNEVNLTTAEVTTWRNHLPMADTGTTAKKVYRAISDCNKVNLEIKERFEILEILRTPVQFVCQSLRKHYINQTNTLTPQQLTIAHLAQTLQTEMANGYKLLIEQLEKNASSELQNQILPIALQRVIYYYTLIIIRCYQLYSIAPKGIWHELHLIYQHAEKKHLLKYNTIADDYKRALIIAATCPYQWRQTEQDSIYIASEVWAPLAHLRNDLANVSDPGSLVIDLDRDHPPLSPTRGLIQFSATCKVLDVNPILNRLKTLLIAIEPNELQARITHSHDPEYAVSTSVLRGLIKEWGTPISRFHERAIKQEPVKLCIGLMATHYYLNGEHPFQSQPSGAEITESHDLSVNLSSINLQTDALIETSSTGDDKSSFSTQDAEKLSAYPLYACTLINENPNGYGLLWANKDYPPIQAGEVMGIEREINGTKTWELGKIRWLQHQPNHEFRIGIERLSKAAKAGSVQLIKEGNPAGYYLRCLMLESSLLVPTIPFKSGNQVMVLQANNNTQFSLELTKLLDATGSYKRFEFNIKQGASENLNLIAQTALTDDNKPKGSASQKDQPKDDKFDSIWSNL